MITKTNLTNNLIKILKSKSSLRLIMLIHYHRLGKVQKK